MRISSTDHCRQPGYTATKELLDCNLPGGPQKSLEVILQNAGSSRRHTGRLRLLIAAGLLLVLLASNVFLPLLTYALAQLPLIGDPFHDLIVSTSLAAAYKAGLVIELHRSVSSGSYTLTVLAAYSDPEENAVLLKLTSTELGRMEQLTAAESWPGVRLSGAFGWNSDCGARSFHHVEAEDAIYGWVKTEPAPWWAGSSWTVAVAGALDDPLQLQVPVHRIWGEFMVPRARLDQTVTCGELQVRLRNIVFLPGRTVLNYYSTNHQPVWELRSGGRSYSEGALTDFNPDPLQGTDFYPVFYPQVPNDLELVLKGYQVCHSELRFLPAEQGGANHSAPCAVTISDLQQTPAGLQVTVSPGSPSFQVEFPFLMDPEGEWVWLEPSEQPSARHKDGSITKTFAIDLDDLEGYQIALSLTEYVPADQEIVVKVPRP